MDVFTGQPIPSKLMAIDPKSKPIPTTVFSRPGQCMLGINALSRRPAFKRTAGGIGTETGDTLAWPDADSKRNTLAMFDRDPESVFVVEFGPTGQPIAEHRIAPYAIHSSSPGSGLG